MIELGLRRLTIIVQIRRMVKAIVSTRAPLMAGKPEPCIQCDWWHILVR